MSWEDQGYQPTGYTCEGHRFVWDIYDKTEGNWGKFVGTLITDAKDSQPSLARKRAVEVTGLPYKLVRVRTQAGEFISGSELWKGKSDEGSQAAGDGSAGSPGEGL